MKRIIVTPTFGPHFPFNREFLASYRQHAEDARDVAVHFIVTRGELAEIGAVMAEFPDLDLHAHAFEDLLAASGHTEDPAALLREIGKFAYQSLKKLYALKAVEYDQALILDSEALILKAVRVGDLFDEYYADPFVLYSDLSQRDEIWFGGQSDAVVRNAAKLLRQPYPKRWFLEYYGWFYDKRIVRDLFALFPEDLLPAIRTRLKDDTRVFENQLFYHFIYANAGKYGYRFTSVNELLTRYLGPDGYASYLRHFEGEGQLTGIFEMVSKTVSRRNLDGLARLFSEQRLRFYRFELVNRNQDEQRELIAQTPIAVMVSSEGYSGTRERIAVCVSGHAVHPRQNLRFLRAFLAENDVDVFTHLWDTADADYIAGTLQPTASEFEVHPRAAAADAAKRVAAAAALAAASNETAGSNGSAPPAADGTASSAIAVTSALAPGDAKAVEYAASLHSLRRANALKRAHETEHGFRYDVVVHLPLDLFSTRPLVDVIEHIRYQQSGYDNVLYVPDMAHGTGLNTQVAIGSSETMDKYASAADDARAAGDAAVAGPDYAMLEHVRRCGLRIRTFPLEYVAVGNANVATFDLEPLVRRTRLNWWSAQLPDVVPASLDAYFAARGASVAAIEALGFDRAKVYRIRAGARGYARYDAAARRVTLVGDAAEATTFFVTTLPNGDLTAVHIQPRDAVVAPDDRPPGSAVRSHDLAPNATGELVEAGAAGLSGSYFVSRDGDGGLTFEWCPGFWQTLADTRPAGERPFGGWTRGDHREEVRRGARLVLQPGRSGFVLTPAGGDVKRLTLEYVPDPVAEGAQIYEDLGGSGGLQLRAGADPLPVRLLGLTYITARVLSQGGTGAFRRAFITYLRKHAHMAEISNAPGLKNALKRQIGRRL